MHGSFVRVGLVTAPTLLASLASAQYESGPIYAKLTLGTPSSSSVRDDLSSLVYGGAVGYTVRTRIPKLDTAVELGYLRSGGSDDWFQAFDLKAVGRYAFGERGVRPYVGLGVGVSYAEIHVHGSGTTSTGGSGGSGGSGGQELRAMSSRASFLDSANSSTRGLWSGILEPVVGLELNKRSFVELGYRIAPKIRGVDQNVISISYGLRF